jgi:DNA-binding MarR family transcriptional regulator
VPPGREPAVEDVDAVADAVLTASRVLVGISARSIAAVDESVTLPQFRLLVVLSMRGPLNLSGLAEYLAVNPSTATRMVNRLLATGMVARETNPASRREIVVTLTPEGQDLVRQVTDRRRQEIARVVARMPVNRRQGLVVALSAFAEAGGEPAVTNPPADTSGTEWS